MYITAAFFNILARQLETEGIELSAIFRRFGSDIRETENPAARIRADIFGYWLEEVVRISGNERIGLETGFEIPLSFTENIPGLYSNSRTVSDVFNNKRLLSPETNTICTYLTRTNGGLLYHEIEIDPDFVRSYPKAARQWYEIQFGICLELAYIFTGKRLQPLLALSAYPRTGRKDLLEKYLPCPVRYGCKKQALVFDKSVLELPLFTVSDKIRPIFEGLIDSLHKDKLLQNHTAVLTTYLRENLSGEDNRIGTIAGKFNMSVRSLQRKLEAEGTSYQHILDQVRVLLAKTCMNEKKTMAETAFLLGFGSQSSFNKFFRKHFGTSPRCFCKEN